MIVGRDKRSEITVRETSVEYRSLEPVTITVESGACRVVEYVTLDEAFSLGNLLLTIAHEAGKAREAVA